MLGKIKTLVINALLPANNPKIEPLSLEDLKTYPWWNGYPRLGIAGWKPSKPLRKKNW